MDLLKFNLQKFSPVSISEPKTTPIQKTLSSFPDVSNERVTTIELDCRYPIIEPMVKQMDQYANQKENSPVLLQSNMGSAADAKEASEAYSNSYLDSIKEQAKDSKIDIPYEGKKTPAAFDPFKPETYMASMGKDSPMSKITRPAKPKTSAAFNK